MTIECWASTFRYVCVDCGMNLTKKFGQWEDFTSSRCEVQYSLEYMSTHIAFLLI